MLGTKENPFESAQVVLHDQAGRLFFHKNLSIRVGQEQLTLFGGKTEKEDQGKGFLTIIRELKEKQEAHISLRPENLKKVCRDIPIEFEKGWFVSQIYSALLSKNTANRIQNAEIFLSRQDFLNRGNDFIWGTSFEHIRGLVDKVLTGK